MPGCKITTAKIRRVQKPGRVEVRELGFSGVSRGSGMLGFGGLGFKGLGFRVYTGSGFRV